MNKFLASYIETALWSSNDGEDNLDDAKYADFELSPAALERMTKDCESFESAVDKLFAGLDDAVIRSIPDREHIAHDFWLTRNHHGTGFWDGDYPEPIATQLTDLAHSYGECDLYPGDDSQFHF